MSLYDSKSLTTHSYFPTSSVLLFHWYAFVRAYKYHQNILFQEFSLKCSRPPRSYSLLFSLVAKFIHTGLSKTSENKSFFSFSDSCFEFPTPSHQGNVGSPVFQEVCWMKECICSSQSFLHLHYKKTHQNSNNRNKVVSNRCDWVFKWKTRGVVVAPCFFSTCQKTTPVFYDRSTREIDFYTLGSWSFECYCIFQTHRWRNCSEYHQKPNVWLRLLDSGKGLASDPSASRWVGDVGKL